MSFLCISSDAEKLTVFAYATDAAVALEEGRGGVRANEWVARTLKVPLHHAVIPPSSYPFISRVLMNLTEPLPFVHCSLSFYFLTSHFTSHLISPIFYTTNYSKKLEFRQYI